MNVLIRHEDTKSSHSAVPNFTAETSTNTANTYTLHARRKEESEVF